MLVVRERETGNEFKKVKSLEEGRALIAEYEQEDKTAGTYTPDFYEVAAIKEFVTVGCWWANWGIDLVYIGGSIYALSGWNGKVYSDCWKCTGDNLMTASKEKFILRPVYEEDSNGDYITVNFEVK